MPSSLAESRDAQGPRMKCPRCQNGFTAAPDATGIVTCPACGARLRARPVNAAAAPASGDTRASLPAASAGPALAAVPSARAVAPGPTMAPGGSGGPALAVKANPSPAAAPALAPAPSPLLESILAELRAVRETQGQILELLRRAPPADAAVPDADEAVVGFGEARPAAAPPAAHPAVRSRRRKSVLIIDDDPRALAEAVEALERAEVPVRSAADGSAGLAAIADEKPDVVVMELALGGNMAGKDVINMIKATMEWVDVPIVLHTRVAIESQRETRQIHGADEYVLKRPGSTDALVGRVISLFRK